MNEQDLNFNENVEITDSFQLKARTYYSIIHLNTAIRFTQKAYEIERKYEGKFDSELNNDLRAYTTSIILSIVAFLEANINELYCDICEASNLRKEINEKDRLTLKNLWSLGIPKTSSYPVLQKYDITLLLLKNLKFNKGISPYQDIISLIKLRNALTHYEPVSIDLIAQDEGKSEETFLK